MMKIKPAQIRLMRSVRGHLVVNPAVSFFQAVAETDGRLPAHGLADLRVVAVAAVDTFGRLQIVNALEFSTQYSVPATRDLLPDAEAGEDQV